MREMKATRWVLTVLAVFLLAFTGIPATTASADHRPDNVVVIGGTLALSGRYAEPAELYLNAWKLYVDELNQRGGLLGHKVELTILDDKSDTRTAIELYEKLITVDKVDLIQGPYSSAITDAVANVMEAHKRPFVATGGSSKAIWERGRKYVFGIVGVAAQDRQKGALYLAKEIGVKRIAIIGQGSLFPRQVTEGTLEWAKKLDLEVVFLQSYHKDEKDFTVILRKIEASGAEAIFSNSYFADCVAQLRQMRELGINVKMFSGTIGPGLPEFVDELGGTAEYVLGFSHKLILGRPAMIEFVDKYEKRYGVKPNYRAAGAYMGMQVLEAAVKHATSLDPQKVRDALASISVEAIRRRVKFDAQGVSMTDEVVTLQVQNGEPMIVWPKHVAEAKYILPMPRWEERPSN